MNVVYPGSGTSTSSPCDSIERHRHVQRLRRAHRHPDLLDVDHESVLARELRDDRLAQGTDAAIRRVPRVTLAPRRGGFVADRLRHDLAGLADGQDDRVRAGQRPLEDVSDARAGHGCDVGRDLLACGSC